MALGSRVVAVVAVSALVAACSGNGGGAATTAGPATTTSGPPATTTTTTLPATTLPAGNPAREFEQVAVIDVNGASFSTLELATFSPDGATILTVAADGQRSTVETRNAGTGQLLTTFVTDARYVGDAHFSRDGTRIVAAGDDGTALVWDAATGALLATLALPARFPPLWSAEFSPDGTQVVTVAGIDEKVTLWDVADERPILDLNGTAAAFSPDGSKIATATIDDTFAVRTSDLPSMLVHIWDSSTGDLLSTLAPEPRQYLSSAVYSPDGTSILTVGTGLATQTAIATVWDTVTQQPVATLTALVDQAMSFVPVASFSDDGTKIVTVHDDGVRVSDATSGAAIAGPFAGEPAVADLGPAAVLLLTANGMGEVALWDVASGELHATLSPLGDAGFTAAEFSADGNGILAADIVGNLQIWRAVSAPPVTVPSTTARSPLPSTTAPTPTPVDPDALLRGDGLGPYRFGDAAADVEAWLVARLGPITAADVVREPLLSEVTYPARRELRWVSWQGGLDVVFSDIGPDGPTPDGSLQFAAWRYSPFGAGMDAGLPSDTSSLLDTPTGVTVGTPLAELRARYPSFTKEVNGPCPGFQMFTTLDQFQPMPYGDAPYGDVGQFDLGATGTAEAGLRGQVAPALPAYVGRLEAGTQSRCPDELIAARDVRPGPTDDRLVLSPNGLSPNGVSTYRIGRSANQLLAYLEATFGPPQQDAAGSRPGATMDRRQAIGNTGYVWAQAFRYLRWYDLGLTVVLSDIVDPEGPPDRLGALKFVGWAAGPRLRTADGTGVGATVATLRAEFDEVTFGRWESTMGMTVLTPTVFHTEEGMSGAVAEWNLVRAVQERLVANGATLEITGAMDNATRTALDSFIRSLGLAIPTPVVVMWPDGAAPTQYLPLSEAIADALDLAPPPDTLITELRS